MQAVQGTLDGGTLRTVLDARNYILVLSEAAATRPMATGLPKELGPSDGHLGISLVVGSDELIEAGGPAP